MPFVRLRAYLPCWRDFGLVAIPEERVVLSISLVFGRKVINVVFIFIAQATGRLQTENGM